MSISQWILNKVQRSKQSEKSEQSDDRIVCSEPNLTFQLLKNTPTPTLCEPPLNILLLADNRHEANVVHDHINSIRKFSSHNIFVVNPIWENIDQCCVLEKIDLILIHYSILILSDYFLPPDNADIVRRFGGAKAQIIQDECRWVNRMKARMDEMNIRAVFSSMKTSNMHKVYGDGQLNDVDFYGCLPGYIPEHLLGADVLPIAERPLDIVYRGRELPFWLGAQAREKTEIGQHMLKVCHKFDGQIDISTDETNRIYGDDWLKFIASGRTNLGVEGGVSIFDFDEQAEKGVQDYLEEHPGADFDEVFDNVLKPYEGNVVHRTITPRIFESICMKTALVLYPGSYSGILEPDRHYIPFDPNGSTDGSILEKITNHTYLQEMVDRTYDEIANRSDLQASFYVNQIDNILAGLHEEFLTVAKK